MSTGMAARVIDFAFACLSHEPLLPFRLTRLARAAALDRAATLAGRHRTDAMLLALPTWHRETAAPPRDTVKTVKAGGCCNVGTISRSNRQVCVRLHGAR